MWQKNSFGTRFFLNQGYKGIHNEQVFTIENHGVDNSIYLCS